ncbi:MAG TPA: nitroreductase family protein [candidate division Zixibacteria bacterium]|nr:nitroreductase family protein [candidate division Zixibacteria bacterium]
MEQDQNSAFFKRHSRRAYLNKPVPQEALERIFEKIRWTPSSANNQPWRFVFVREKEIHDRLVDEGLSRGNAWAKAAPILVVVYSKEDYDGVRSDDPVKYYQFDSGMANMALLLASVEEGLMPHPMGGYRAADVKRIVGIPEEFHVLCVVALGFEGSIDQLDERTREKDQKPRTRKAISEIISFDKFSAG